MRYINWFVAGVGAALKLSNFNGIGPPLLNGSFICSILAALLLSGPSELHLLWCTLLRKYPILVFELLAQYKSYCVVLHRHCPPKNLENYIRGEML